MRTEREHRLAVAVGKVEDDDTLAYLGQVASGEIDDEETLQTLQGVRSEVGSYLRECLDAGETPPTAPARFETFAMVPNAIVTSTLDDGCVRLYAFLDGVQGQDGRPPAAGVQAIADRLGWARNSVAKHARHLEEAGLVVVEREGHKRVVLDVVHNPSRKRCAPGVALDQNVPPARKPSTTYTNALPVAQEVSASDCPQADATAQTVSVHAEVPRKKEALDAQPLRDRSAPLSASEEVVVCNQPESRVLAEHEGPKHNQLRQLAPDEPWPANEALPRLLAAFPGAVAV